MLVIASAGRFQGEVDRFSVVHRGNSGDGCLSVSILVR